MLADAGRRAPAAAPGPGPTSSAPARRLGRCRPHPLPPRCRSFRGGCLRIGPELRERLIGRNWTPGCPVALEDLRLVRGELLELRRGKVRTGPLVLNERVASDVLWVFRRLFRAQFPIEEIKLAAKDRPITPEDYWDRSRRSVTASFNCRLATGSTTTLSQHSYGWAIDINPAPEPVRPQRRDGAPRDRVAVPQPVAPPERDDPRGRRGGPLVRPDRLGVGRPLAHPEGLHALLVDGEVAAGQEARVQSPLEARADVVGSLLRPPELLDARERLARNELSPAAFKRVEDRAVDESAAPAGGERPGRRHRRRDAASVLPESAHRGGRGLRRLGPRRVPVGNVAERRARGREDRAAADRRRGHAPAKAVPLGGGVHLHERPDRPDREGHPPEPEPVRELLGSGPLRGRVRLVGVVPRRRRGDPSRGGRRARSVSAPPTSNSTRRTIRCSSIPRIGSSTRAGVGRPIGGSSSARSSTTSSSPTTPAWCSASICAGGTR